MTSRCALLPGVHVCIRTRQMLIFAYDTNQDSGLKREFVPKKRDSFNDLLRNEGKRRDNLNFEQSFHLSI